MAKHSRTKPFEREALPYRDCAGVLLFNDQGKVFMGERVHMPAGHKNAAWQMPQGGIDTGEDPFAAARRELREETNVRSAELLAGAEDWLSYDFPDEVMAQKRRNKFRGQRQMWFAMLFTGDESEIDVAHPDNGAHRAEFADWRWESLENLPRLIVPFKRDVYVQLGAWFADLPERIRSGDIVGSGGNQERF